MVLITPDEKNHNGGRSDDGSCNTVLSADCIKDIITHVNNIAASYSGTFGGTNSTEFSCFDLMNGIIGDEKSKCWQQYGYFHDLFLPEYPGIISSRKATYNPIVTCPSVGPGDMLNFHMDFIQADDQVTSLATIEL